LPDAVAAPLENDIYEWHVNIRGPPGSPVRKGVWHLIFKFKQSYPTTPPTVDLMTLLPHPFVFSNKHGKKNWICLDLLEDGEFVKEEDKNMVYTGWSSAYSIHSILIQLQSFLMDDEMHYATYKVTLVEAIKTADSFKCNSCLHNHKGRIWPEFPTEEQLLAKKPIPRPPVLLKVEKQKPLPKITAKPASNTISKPIQSNNVSQPINNNTASQPIQSNSNNTVQSEIKPTKTFAELLQQSASPEVKVPQIVNKPVAKTPVVKTPAVTPAINAPPPIVNIPPPKPKPAANEWITVNSKKPVHHKEIKIATYSNIAPKQETKEEKKK